MIGPILAARLLRRPAWLAALADDHFMKELSGYTLVGLCLLSLLVSLRKRWKRFSYSEVPIFRMLHAVLGALTLITLLLHTGLSVSHHMLQVLAADFLAVTLLGAIAGIITAVSARWNPIKARDRRLRFARIHLIACWPLPVLVILHVLQVYYY